MMGAVPGLFGWIFVVGREYRSPENCSDTSEFVTTNALMNSLSRKKNMVLIIVRAVFMICWSSNVCNVCAECMHLDFVWFVNNAWDQLSEKGKTPIRNETKRRKKTVAADKVLARISKCFYP
jgi:hypothetical protein